MEPSMCTEFLDHQDTWLCSYWAAINQSGSWVTAEGKNSYHFYVILWLCDHSPSWHARAEWLIANRSIFLCILLTHSVCSEIWSMDSHERIRSRISATEQVINGFSLSHCIFILNHQLHEIFLVTVFVCLFCSLSTWGRSSLVPIQSLLYHPQ